MIWSKALSKITSGSVVSSPIARSILFLASSNPLSSSGISPRTKILLCLYSCHLSSIPVTLEKLEWFNENARESLKWTNKVLTEENKKFLKELPETLEVKDQKNRLLAVHGSPKDHLYEYLEPTTDEDKIKDMLEDQKADVIACGHTHMPDVKKFELKLFLNPGSVGQPRNNNSKAHYAILDLSNINFVTLEQVEYDIDTAAKKIIQAGLPRFLADRLYVGR